MTKGIVGIQSTFGIGGVGDRCMIDLEMYKKASEAAAAKFKLQLQSENCDFIPVTTVPIGTTKVAVAGYIQGMSGTAKIGGVTVPYGFATRICICLLWDIFTDTVEWINVDSPGTPPSGTDNYYNLFVNVLVKSDDDSTLYWKYNTINQNSVAKIVVSTGAITRAPAGAGTSDSAENARLGSITLMGSYVYIMYVKSNVAYGRRIATSDLSAGSETALSAFTASGSFLNNNIVIVSNDGTYVYWSGSMYDGTDAKRKVKTVRSDSAIGSQTVTDTYYAYTGTPAYGTWLAGLVRKGSTEYTGLIDYDGSWNILNAWISDGTNKTTDCGGKLFLANNVIYSNKRTSAKSIQKINDDTSVAWSNTYSSEAFSRTTTVFYMNSNLYMAGFGNGDFDGNHASNTKYCLVIAKIDPDTGEMI